MPMCLQAFHPFSSLISLSLLRGKCLLTPLYLSGLPDPLPLKTHDFFMSFCVLVSASVSHFPYWVPSVMGADFSMR